jgi:D-3-phosphoglycerate dehydrogenase
MAAETIRQYLETGTIRHSVNFPDTALPEQEMGCIRITVVNENIPGMLSKITEVFANHNINIQQQINHSRGDVAYNVIDVDPTGADSCNLKDLQKEVTMLGGVLSSRILFGTAGVGYARNIDGKYHV